MKRTCLLLILSALLILVVSSACAGAELRGYDPADKSLQYVSFFSYPYETHQQQACANAQQTISLQSIAPGFVHALWHA